MNIAAPGRFAMRDPSATGWGRLGHWGAAFIDPRNDARPAGSDNHRTSTAAAAPAVRAEQQLYGLPYARKPPAERQPYNPLPR